MIFCDYYIFRSATNRMVEKKRENERKKKRILRNTVKYRFFFLIARMLRSYNQRARDLMSTSIFYESKNISSAQCFFFHPWFY